MKKLIFTLFIFLVATQNVFAQPVKASALRLAKKIAINAARQAASSVHKGVAAEKSKVVDFRGYWHGAFVRVAGSCTGFASSFGFRHAISIAGNQVSLNTSHDGLLGGITRKAGTELEATRVYSSKGIPVAVAVVYRAPQVDKRGVRFAPAGFAVRYGSCLATYGANAIFAGS